MDIKELYRIKGELMTRVEILQAQLQTINQEILKLLKISGSKEGDVLKPVGMNGAMPGDQ